MLRLRGFVKCQTVKGYLQLIRKRVVAPLVNASKSFSVCFGREIWNWNSYSEIVSLILEFLKIYEITVAYFEIIESIEYIRCKIYDYICHSFVLSCFFFFHLLYAVFNKLNFLKLHEREIAFNNLLNYYIIDIIYYKLNDYNIYFKEIVWLNKIFAEFQINILLLKKLLICIYTRVFQ